MVRYATNFVILCRSEDEAKAALTRVQNMGSGKRSDPLHPEKRLGIVEATNREVLTSLVSTSSGVIAGRAAKAMDREIPLLPLF